MYAILQISVVTGDLASGLAADRSALQRVAPGFALPSPMYGYLWLACSTCLHACADTFATYVCTCW